MQEQSNVPVRVSRTPAKNRKSIVTGVLAVAIIAMIGVSGFLYSELRDARNNPEKISQVQVENLVERVGKLISLPADEQPTVATVQDKEKLADQPFFSGAENGDKLLIYTTAQKAIIYRESTNSLVNVGPVTLDTATPVGATTEATPIQETPTEETPQP